MRIEKLTLARFGEPNIRESAVASARNFAAEAGYPFPVDGGHFLRFWDSAIMSGVGSFYVALNESDTVVGGFGGVFFPDCFSGELHASESFWFLNPEARGTSVGLKMFNAFEAEAKERGCKALVMIHLAGLNEAPLDRLYLRKGYSRAEQVFRKIL